MLTFGNSFNRNSSVDLYGNKLVIKDPTTPTKCYTTFSFIQAQFMILCVAGFFTLIFHKVVSNTLSVMRYLIITLLDFAAKIHKLDINSSVSKVMSKIIVAHFPDMVY